MLFSSITFIYFFIPLLLLVYFITPAKYRNIPLLIFSLIFYFLGEPKYIIVLIICCIINYYISRLMVHKKYKKYKTQLLILALIYDIGQLLIKHASDMDAFNKALCEYFGLASDNAFDEVMEQLSKINKKVNGKYSNSVDTIFRMKKDISRMV